MKKVLILCGPGFSDQEDIKALLESRGDRVKLCVPSDPAFVNECASADIILLRGPWTACPEERLLVRAIADQLSKGLEKFEERQADPETAPILIGIGRGALVALASRALGLCDFDTLEWSPVLSQEKSWIDVRYSEVFKDYFPALIQGRACPNLKSTKLHKDLTPWLNPKVPVPEAVLGLRRAKTMYLSLVDLLAYGERTQMPDYGYRDLSSLPNQGAILFALMDGNF